MLEGGELVVGARQYTIDRTLAAEFPGSSPGDYVRVTVKDGGRGLSPARLERVFYPETTTRPAAAAAWQLMRRIGGFAAVESAEGIGTAVHLYFCRAVGIAESASPPSADDVHALAAE
jgi:signal transduction histidine kinase